MTLITDLPVELHIDVFLPMLPLKDLLNLGATNKHFAVLCNDNTLWKRKLDTDFNFNGRNTARTGGWKFIYLRLTNPRVYVWGQRDNGRLGLAEFPKSTIRGVPYPTQLRFPGRRIVNIVAGGMSFHALDAEGHVHVWGTLNGESQALPSDGYSEPGKSAPTPLRLELPNPTRSISCGRLHSVSLDSKKLIWNFVSWGRPFRLLSDSFDPDTPPVQVECGWAFTTALTKSGVVLVWWPFSGTLGSKLDQRTIEMDKDDDKKALPNEGAIPCCTWEIEAEPVVLPPLPRLPDLPIENRQEETKIIQIAAYDNHLVALTNNGHVLMFDSLDGEDTVSAGRWHYLPKFSEIDEIRAHPTFAENKATPPDVMQVTHVSAHYSHFIAYSTGSSSVVLMGDVDTTSESNPEVIPELQNRSVISVVLGDYHSGALTADGKFLTWGAYSNGALGLGDPADIDIGAPGGFETEDHRLRAVERHVQQPPPPVQVPTEVRFDHKRKKSKDRFVISATASGWHTGALVIDLEPNENDADSDVEEEKEEEHEDRAVPPFRRGRGRGGHLPLEPFFRGGSIFRVGFAGRGR